MPLAIPSSSVEHRHEVAPAAIGAGASTKLGAVAGQLARFTGIGAVMMLAYLLLYTALQGILGMQGANVIAWLATAVADTSANRRLTFSVTGRAGAVRAQVLGLLVFGTGMVITSGALLALSSAVTSPGEVLQLASLVGANVVAGLLRFTLLRHWVFAPRLEQVPAPRPRRAVGRRPAFCCRASDRLGGGS